MSGWEPITGQEMLITGFSLSAYSYELYLHQAIGNGQEAMGQAKRDEREKRDMWEEPEVREKREMLERRQVDHECFMRMSMVSVIPRKHAHSVPATPLTRVQHRNFRICERPSFLASRRFA